MISRDAILLLLLASVVSACPLYQGLLMADEPVPLAPAAAPAPDGKIEASMPANPPDGDLVDHTGPHYYNAFRCQAAADMTVNALRIKFASDGIGELACAIYSDVAGKPGNLIAETAPIVDPHAGWQTLALRQKAALKGGESYWLVEAKEFAAAICSSEKKDASGAYAALTYGSWPSQLPAPAGNSTSRHCLYACLIPALMPAGLAPANPDTMDLSTSEHLVVDPEERYQTLKGWGISLCWWAHVFGEAPDDVRNQCADLIFNPDTGLGLNYVRYNIGGGENPKFLPPNKAFLQYRGRIPGYQPEKGRYTWDTDEGQRWMLSAAIKRGANIVEAFSNSPPYWMTISGSVTGGIDGGANLADEHVDDFVDYLANVADHFDKQFGIKFDAIEPFNEPVSGWWKYASSTQEGCRIDYPQQQIIISKLHAALAGNGLNTPISAADDNSIAESYINFRNYSSGVKSGVAHYTTHSYTGGAYRVKLRKIAEADGKPIWHSEYGDGDASGLTMAATIVHDLKYLRPEVWAYWQAVDGGGWGLLSGNLRGAVSALPSIAHKYHVLAQFTRYMRPGCRLIGVNDASTLASLDDSGRLAIVVLNESATERSKQIDLTRFPRVATTCDVITTSSDQDEKKSQLSVNDGSATLVLSPKSVTTIVIGTGRAK